MQSKHTTPIFSNDYPKMKIAEDMLGYADFAQAIAGAIVNMPAPEGVVMAIHGPWGSGKTSAINMVVDAIGQIQESSFANEKVIVVRFNPWWVSEQQDLTLSFFSELSAALGTTLSQSVKDKLRKLALRASGSKDLVTAAMSFLPGGAIAGQVGAELASLVSERFADNGGLDKARRDLQEALRAEGKRILVIIDDVDRLPTDEIKQIFRLVKSVADLPGVIHMLVFDRLIADRALSGLAVDGGPAWIEKIVQASFDLPPIHITDLHSMVFRGLEEILGNKDIGDEVRWANVFHDAIAPWLKTPRDVTRFLNAIRVSWPAVQDEVNVPDFLAIELLRVFEPLIYSVIRENSDKLVGVNYMGSRSGTDKTIGDDLLLGIPTTKQEQIKAALQRLFPRLESVWGNHFHTSTNDWEKSMRICAPKRFSNYFSFGVSDDVISRSEIKDFIAILPNKEGVKQKILELSSQKRRSGGTRAAVLLEDIKGFIDNTDQQVIKDAVSSLLYAGDAFLNDIDEKRGAFGIPSIWNISFAIEPLLGMISPENREEIMSDAIKTSPSLTIVSYMTLLFSRQHGRHGEKEPIDPERRLLDEDAIIRLEEKLATRLSLAAIDGTLLESSKSAQCLYAWKDVGSDHDIREWMAECMGDDAKAILLAKVFTGEGISHAMGDRVSRRTFNVSREGLDRFMDADKFIQRVQEISKKEDNSPADQEIISNFLKGLDNKRIL